MKKKQDIITFKVDEDLGETIRDIPNRSEFIRKAIIAALGSVCPLCEGRGMLTPKQKQHWEDFALHHAIERCQDCDERVLVCESNPSAVRGSL
ncbi:MAG: CopG family transcriptional regulator [Desulfatiglandales bacterium]